MTTLRPRQTALGNPSGMKSDPCTKTVEEKQSVEPCDYMLTNFYGFCDIEQPEKIRIEERGNQLWNGYNFALGCNVDNDSHLRLDSQVTNPRIIHQLFERPALTVPFMGSGNIRNQNETDLESFLRVGYQTGEKKPCNVLSEISIDIPRFAFEKWNCIQENSVLPPQLGPYQCGRDSRSDVRRAMYNKRCKFATSP